MKLKESLKMTADAVLAIAGAVLITIVFAVAWQYLDTGTTSTQQPVRQAAAATTGATP